MNSDLFRDFYYNIIPGSCFLIYWLSQEENVSPKIITFFSKNHYESLAIVAFLVIALSIGLIIHGIFRTSTYLYRWMQRCKNHDYQKNLDKIYMMNASLWGKDKRSLPEYFSSRAAMWGSFSIGILLTLILRIRLEYYGWYILIFFLFLILYFVDRNKELKSIETTFKLLRDRRI